MSRFGELSTSTKGLRLARKAWQLLHQDSARSVALAREAIEVARHGADTAGEAWAHLAIGFHLLYFGTPAEAAPELTTAQQQFDSIHDRAGYVLAGTGLARCLWREGKFAASLDLVLPLREEGLQVLRHEQRGVMLNTIAGCYSAQGRSEQAFAYMYQALRDSGPTHGHGFDAVLYCNLAHELLQIGDYHEALRYLDQGISRCHHLNNPRLLSVLLINRVICLTELDRAQEAMLDVSRVRSLPTGSQGRGTIAMSFETMAIAALRAGEHEVGRDLVEQARAAPREQIPDEHVELAIAAALLAGQEKRWPDALQDLERALPLVGADDADAAEGLSLRVRCMYFLIRSEIHEQLGDTAQALAHMRIWQQLHVARAHMASRARYQAAALQTELMRLQHKLDEQQSQRRATERARAELETTNAQLSRKMAEVQALQEALHEQAVRDALTGLFNRRYLNETLPTAFALAQREHQALGGGHHRPRSLQGRERPLRPRRRRHAARGLRPAAAGALPQERRGVPLRRRGVLPADAAHRRQDRAAQGGRAARALAAAALRDRRRHAERPQLLGRHLRFAARAAVAAHAAAGRRPTTAESPNSMAAAACWHPERPNRRRDTPSGR